VAITSTLVCAIAGEKAEAERTKEAITTLDLGLMLGIVGNPWVRVKSASTLYSKLMIFLMFFEKPYLEVWGQYPEEFCGKKWIRIEDVAEVDDSPTRLRARFATLLYRSARK
jgi:hypothetical protein